MKNFLVLAAFFALSALAAAVNVDQCRELNDSSTVYELTQNVSKDGGYCMNVTANGVTLDCKGYWLNGAGGAYAVDVNANNTLVRGCVVSGFYQGVTAELQSYNTTVFNSSFYSNTIGTAMGLGSHNITVQSSNFTGDDYGIMSYFADGVVHDSNRITDSVLIGIWIYGTLSNTTNNAISTLNGTGIQFSDSSGGNVFMNNITNSWIGIRTHYGSMNVSNNNLNNNTYGIHCWHQDKVMLNSINNSVYGIYLNPEGASGFEVLNNSVNESTYGIFSGAFSAQINYNTIRSSDYGIYLSGAVQNSLEGNDVSATNPFFFKLGGTTIVFGTANISGIVEESLATGAGFVAINASKNPTLNQSATVTMNFSGTCPRVNLYYAADYYSDLDDIILNGNLCNSTSAPSCSVMSCSSGEVTFAVEHFDSYGGQGYEIPEFPGFAALAAILLAAGGYAFAKKRR